MVILFGDGSSSTDRRIRMKINGLEMNIKRSIMLIAVAVFSVMLMAGCYNPKTGEVNFGGAINFELPAFPDSGPHAVQVFSEMHYSPAYRSQEVPRLLPPDGSVPVTGSEVVVFDVDQLKSLVSPITEYDSNKAQKVYKVNCQVCHGANLLGEGPITSLPSNRGDGTLVYEGAAPVNLLSERVTSLTDGEIFGYISWGGRPGLAAAARGKSSSAIMPQFSKLLTEEERWQLVSYLRELAGQ